ncbi:GGDEF domain-containing protein [Vibrio algarum]|uniref:diguanylate cyclase n=1 Tax=Vibrio algarum TaxID=3020714 RepID=A0ABT4YRA3_9VIBR|nr:GGDEF domain-containing protein [Vibrio sp. KJ40-1]MDB1124053.1 GGDEF domain-containing protein [Vibrio sp. KJ40-1]
MDQEPNRLSEIISVLDTLPDRVFILSSSGQFLDVFGGTDTNVHFSANKLVGANISDIMETEAAQTFQAVIDKSLQTHKTQNHVYTLSPQQHSTLPEAIIPIRTQWYEGRVHILAEKYKEQDAVVWISRNITDSYELKERLIELSEIDDLTQLLNRRAFSERIKQCFGCRKRYNVNTSIILIDVDYFKSINDNFGHPFGDETIKQIAKIITEEVREVDSAGRLGGEEFSVILNMTDIIGAQLTAERIRNRIELHDFSFFGKQANITVSIGVSQINASDEDQTDVFHRADAALYESKEAGRNRVTVIRGDE